MALFRFLWLRKFIRRHTKPIPEDSAATWKKRLSLIYMLAAWNAFGLVCYCVYNGKGDWAKFHGLPQAEGTPAQQWSKTLGIKDATVYRVSGFNVSKYEVHNEFDKNKEAKTTESAEVISG